MKKIIKHLLFFFESCHIYWNFISGEIPNIVQIIGISSIFGILFTPSLTSATILAFITGFLLLSYLHNRDLVYINEHLYLKNTKKNFNLLMHYWTIFDWSIAILGGQIIWRVVLYSMISGSKF